MIWLLGAPSSEALPSVTHHRQQILQDWVIAAAFVEVAGGCFVSSGFIALPPRKSLLGKLGTHCLSEEHSFEELQFVPGFDSLHKGARGVPWKEMNDKNPKTWLTYTAREFSVIACCLLATDKRTQGHTRGISFSEKNCVPSKKRDRIIKLDRGILWS